VLISLFNVSAVSATSVVCQKKVGTGHGTYSVDCFGKTIHMTGYYADSSERYFIGNYTGDNAYRYKNSAGVYVEKK